MACPTRHVISITMMVWLVFGGLWIWGWFLVVKYIKLGDNEKNWDLGITVLLPHLGT
jgi:hypothetical protein